MPPPACPGAVTSYVPNFPVLKEFWSSHNYCVSYKILHYYCVKNNIMMLRAVDWSERCARSPRGAVDFMVEIDKQNACWHASSILPRVDVSRRCAAPHRRAHEQSHISLTGAGGTIDLSGLISGAGRLTNNGLDLGAMAAGNSVTVQIYVCG